MDKTCDCGNKFSTYDPFQKKCPKCQYQIAMGKKKAYIEKNGWPKKNGGIWNRTKKAAPAEGGKKRQPSAHTLAKKHAWDWVSRWVRILHSKSLVCKCVTCGKWHDIKDIDAGHYISRANAATIYDMDNLRPQCSSCNRFQQGKHFEFEQALILEIGKERVEALKERAKGFGDDSTTYHNMIEQEYKQKVKDWQKKNNIKLW